MTSSRFNQRPVQQRKPSICIAPTGSCLPEFDRRRPPDLYGFLWWKDTDPLGPMDATALFRTGPRSPAGIYTGHVHIGPVTLGATITDYWPTPTVTVQVSYEDDFWPLETHDFPPVEMPIDQPFSTRILRETFFNGIAWRYTWWTY